MLNLNVLILVFNGLTLSLALGFLILILWHNAQKRANQFFATFLFLIIVWNIGSLAFQASSITIDDTAINNVSLALLEFGFVGTSIGLYGFTTVIVGVHNKRFRYLAFLILLVILFYRLFLIVNENTIVIADNSTSNLEYNLQPFSILSFIVFDSITLFVVWYYRRKIRSKSVIIGILIFLFGQSIAFLNPDLAISAFSTNVSSMGALILSFAIVQQEIINPLSERVSQVEAMHQVSLSITSQISLDTVLDEIALQASQWLNADGSGIFLSQNHPETVSFLELKTVYGLPSRFTGTKIQLGDGIVGKVAQTRVTMFVENYGRDWSGYDDLPMSKETFGSVICVPLVYGGSVIGVLLVIAGQQGRLFGQEDVYLLELLASQASVAIAHSRLFGEQQELTTEVEKAHTQLKTVLNSTENPVIAVDRQLQVIFANPAAYSLYPMVNNTPIINYVPASLLPDSAKTILKAVRETNSYTYEIVIDDKTYLCHVTTLGESHVMGWVAILNDVTQLKELDRLKSEMVRMASHDLKNPLMGAMAYLELLDEDLEAVGNANAREAVAIIEWQLERMNRIIRGILDLEKLDTNSVLFDVCDPVEIVEIAMMELSQFIADKGVEVETVFDVSVGKFLGDREQFKHVLMNLIENAVKFSVRDDSIVTVRITSDKNSVLFSVEDNGVGIPAEIQNKVFERFFRGQQSGIEHITGSGLGLSFVKTIVENHHGDIWLESTAQEGTRFYIKLPLLDT